jgi:signal transduction histidine kinase/ActR/RegA family two-component response regulator
MEAFSRIASRIVQEDDLNAACRVFLEAIREHSGFGRAILTLIDESGRDTQWFFAGIDDATIDHFHRHRMTPAQRATALHERHRVGGSFVVPSSEAIGHGGLPAPPVPGTPPPLVFVPLHGAKGTLCGSLMLDRPHAGEAPGPVALSPLELFASQMAHAIEKKRLDQAVRQMHLRLRAVQEQLMQAEKLSAIGQLISGVAHELNNPLAGIMGFAQLILKTETSPPVRKNLDRIHNEAVRCQKIVQNLLGFSRRHRPEKSAGSLNALVDSVLELRENQLQVDGVEVIRRYDADLPRTMFDFHQMQQVVLNIVNNAHQAMLDNGDRPRRIAVTTTREGAFLRAAFTDTGPGIAADRLESIFDPFYTTKKEGKGTGLGLSVARGILREHQGTMRATSVVGEGTTFVVELPLVEIQGATLAAAAAAAAGSTSAAAGTPAVAAHPMRLLVVDDEPVLVDLLSEFLLAAGHQVEEARDGAQGLEMARAGNYDVILSDLKMPGLDGQGFYERLVRERPEMARRFIFSTGDLANPKVQTFFQKTGCLYLCKPFKLEAVLQILDELARTRSAA